jgi:hypothetical protein
MLSEAKLVLSEVEGHLSARNPTAQLARRPSSLELRTSIYGGQHD